MGTTWENGPIPMRLFKDWEFAWKVRAEVMSEMMSDEPSPSDVQYVFRRYEDSTPEERDAMNAAFVWMTGYTLQSLVARVVVGDGGDWSAQAAKWNRKRPARKKPDRK